MTIGQNDDRGDRELWRRARKGLPAAEGLPDDGIAPGTRWEDVPLNWVCPECGAGKEDFELVEV